MLSFQLKQNNILTNPILICILILMKMKHTVIFISIVISDLLIIVINKIVLLLLKCILLHKSK